MPALQPNHRDTHERSQEGLITAMLKPEFYPNAPAQVIHKETHISHVFLAGDRVYKIKKPVRFSFLNYSTLSRRHHFLQEELRLNRRLAPSVYLAVMPITFASRRWQLGGKNTPREYTLVMRHLPEQQMLATLLASGQVTGEMMQRLAEVVGGFHSQAEAIGATEVSRQLPETEKQWNDNLSELRPFAGRLITAESLKTLEDFGARFIDRHRELFLRRAAQGWIRDVHGDLHCEHICFASEGIQIYDCIEFDPKLRRCDLASEIAFLLMDLQVRGGAALREPFMKRYLELTKDSELPLLLPFYECYRALVRGKVEALRAETAAQRAPRYFRYALTKTWQPLKPFLIMVGGLTGSGKSTLSRELAERLGMPLINSDAVRKQLAGATERNIVPYQAGIYSEAMTRKTYARMMAMAQEQVLSGAGAILDATFSRRENRQDVLRLAETLKVPLVAVRCFASDKTTQERLERRAREGKDLSDGRWEIYERQKQTYEPMDEFSPASLLELNTENATAESASRVERFLRSRIIQGTP